MTEYLTGGGAKAVDLKDNSPSFFKHVFNFDEENKDRMLNMLQYTLIALVPVMLLLRVVKHYVPEEDDTKGSLEILFESVAQLVILMVSIWLINKLVTFIPTYSKRAYNDFNEITFVIPFLLLLITMQTKLGAKLNILFDRVTEAWFGKSEQAKAATVAVLAQQQQGGQVRVQGVHMPSQADYLDRTQLLPTNPQLTAMPNMNMMAQPSKAQPDFDAMYQHTPTPLVGAANPTLQEPMAANEMGGSWGSAW